MLPKMHSLSESWASRETSRLKCSAYISTLYPVVKELLKKMALIFIAHVFWKAVFIDWRRNCDTLESSVWLLNCKACRWIGLGHCAGKVLPHVANASGCLSQENEKLRWETKTALNKSWQIEPNLRTAIRGARYNKFLKFYKILINCWLYIILDQFSILLHHEKRILRHCNYFTKLSYF